MTHGWFAAVLILASCKGEKAEQNARRMPEVPPPPAIGCGARGMPPASCANAAGTSDGPSPRAISATRIAIRSAAFAASAQKIGL